ncbi:hypothetical protein AB0N73_10975 [Microbacterium sp. NPDC089189]|uniref:hypothetical protein n=1 Tax=Microbacterium sp. NPDC089189 TaxID=3154972 RepID=UPI003418D61F
MDDNTEIRRLSARGTMLAVVVLLAFCAAAAAVVGLLTSSLGFSLAALAVVAVIGGLLIRRARRGGIGGATSGDPQAHSDDAYGPLSRPNTVGLGNAGGPVSGSPN